MITSAQAAALLNREIEPIYGLEARQLIKDQVVLVTGAGGSIGSELVRQLLRLDAGEVYFLDHDEFALYNLQLDVSGTGLLDDARFVLSDVRDWQGIDRVFAEVKPDIVYHAAAYKHLPLLERSPAAGVQTNVFGTETIVRACLTHGVRRFINISTDKAARPTSVLGMTKRLAELVAASAAGHDTGIASVRFGNVLGSRGSFFPTLAWQIASGRTVKVTHPDVSRYFMTIPEAAGLVIEASVLARAGETYVLDMGPSIRILDLIDRYVTLAGATYPEIEFTGLRAGEKLHEELFDPSEIRMETVHPRISRVDADAAGALPPHAIRDIYADVQAGVSPKELRLRLEALIADGAEEAFMGATRWAG
ncbi:polysaccharide biosynthesis protein [Actinopolymorpha pittospori]|uniref:FlaA1/EpsC-like NDP-sugar epimerase n=1 Tax=Actinopolymorpha pittospori TaxID=648752 RepID=A0A927MN43_9ACTN|nr:FlaA1/EpsC-like NDP-sugar epimerase [Actinopolymorpha pittospori]